MSRPRYNHVLVVKGAMIVHAHLCGVELDERYESQKLTLLKKAPLMVKAMVASCRERQYLKQCMAVIKFEQLLTQGMWVNDDTVSGQTPHVTQKMVKTWPKVKSIKEFASLTDAEREALPNFANLTDVERGEVHAAAAAIPRVTAKVSAFVQDDSDAKIYAEDLVTVRAVMTRENISPGGKAADVYAAKWPASRPEGWWIILSTREGKIVSVEKVTKPDRVFKQDVKFMSPPPGSYEMHLHVMSDSYVGVDQTVPIKFDVLSPSLLPEYKVHEDDAALDDEPTLFDQLMAGNIEEESDSEEEKDKDDGEDDDDSSDDDDDSDSDDELELKKKK